MKTILLTVDQIPMFWDAIKHTAIKAGYVEEEYIPKFLNRLLYLLLSGKSQCFVRLSDDRILQAILITALINDPLRDEKTLFISYVFSYEKVEKETWEDDLALLKRVAKGSGCKYVTTTVMNERAGGLCEKAGMELRSWNYQAEIGGV